mgnify:CR=1 FL=1
MWRLRSQSIKVNAVIKVKSKRLLIRELSEKDVTTKYVAWMNDPHINRYLETRFSAQTEESVGDFVNSIQKDPDSFLFGIFDVKTGSHIGNIKLGPINRHHGSAQISLLIGDRSCHGKGYATEAISALTDWGFQDCGLERIEAGCYETNLGSLRAFLKCGYEVEGFFRKSRIDGEGQRIGSFWFARLNTKDD